MPEHRLHLSQQIAQTVQDIEGSDARALRLIEGVRQAGREALRLHGKTLAIGAAVAVAAGVLFFPRHGVRVGKQVGKLLLNTVWTTGLPWLMDPVPGPSPARSQRID